MDSSNDISKKRLELERFPPGQGGWFDALTDLVDALYGRFKADGRIDNLDEVITLLRDALELQPVRDDDRSLSLSNLAVCLSNRYENQGVVGDLEEAITFGRAALELCPPGHRDRCVSLHNLGCDLRTRFMKQAAVADLEEAIELLRTTLELQPSGHPHRSSSLHQLSLCLWNRYENQGAVADLEEAITLGRAALELRPRGHPDRVISLNSLAHLLRSFQKQASICDLEEAIKLLRAALELNPYGNLHQAFSYHELALCLSDRYDSQGVLTDLEEAIKLGLNALELHLPGHPDHGVSLYNLACNLRRRFVRQARISDLEVAIKLHRAALELRPSGHPRRSSSLHQLAICLSSRYDNQGVAADLEEAVTLGRAALEILPLGHSDRVLYLNNLAQLLRRRFRKQASICDLEEAIELLRSALELRPSGHIHRTFSFHQLALCLSNRYDNQGVAADLDEAIVLGRAALELCPPAHLDRGVSLINLACDLRRRFQKQATRNDLEEAIELLREALKLCPSGHPCWSFSLHQLALSLSNRYDSQGAVTDLEEAVTLRRTALEILPLGHPHRSVVLYNLACDLWTKFQKRVDMPRLHRATSPHQARSQRPVDVPFSFFELSLHFWVRFQKQAALADLDEAICLATYALELRLPEHPDYTVFFKQLACFVEERVQRLTQQSKSLGPAVDNLGALANYLRDRSRNQRVIADLAEPITLHRYVLQFRPTGHPSRASSLHDLAQCLVDRFRQRPATAGLDEAILLEQEALQLLMPGDPGYDVSQRCLMAYLQLKISSEVATNASGVTDFDVKQAVRSVAFETLKSMPTRLLHTRTGILCNRDMQISHFMNSQQYNQLVSSCAPCDPAQQMKLIRTEVSEYFQYVMLSHRWGVGEPSLRDVEGHAIYGMSTNGGFGKLQAFCLVACARDYLWAWSDTCCIDKNSSAELQEAIGSMFAWYRQSSLTIVYLYDIPDTGSFGNSEWFRRGWTLQELLASRSILFYTQTWSVYKNRTSSNHKADLAVLEELERATGIESRFLTDFSPGMDDARSRLQWASLRRTTRPEDVAYSLFGIFNLHLPVLYGESAENALGRLLSEIISQSGDISVLDWVGEASRFHSCFPAHVTSYQKLALPPPRPIAEEKATAVHAEQPASSSITLRMLYRSLAKAPLPRFINRRLILPCIAYRVTAIQRRMSNPSTRNYTYKFLASGLRPVEIALPSKLESATISQGALLLARPWHSKLLDPFTDLYATTEEQLLFTLEQPFSALLLTKLPHNEYRRIASSNLIIAQPVDSVSILRSKLRVFDIV